MNENKPYDPRYLHLIFSALLMTQLVLTSVVLYVSSESASIFLLPFAGNTYAIPGIAFVLLLLGRYVWNNGMREISTKDNLFEKLEILTKIHIWRWVLVQLGTLILLTYTLVEGNFYYFIFALVNIVYFFTLRPKIFGLAGEL